MDRAKARKLAWSYRHMAKYCMTAADQIIKAAAEIKPDQDDDTDMEHIDQVFNALAKLQRQVQLDLHSVLVDIGIVAKRRAKHAAGKRTR